jgi:Sorting nexin C terminal/PX domain
VNHIDRQQLRRNGLLCPRYPTILRHLSVTVGDAVFAHEIQGVELFGATGTLFKIRCVATVEVAADDCELEGDPGFVSQDGSLCKTAVEEWVVYRSFKDFQAFHKHIKNQVSVSESSGTAGSRLVGAATAAFATANGLPGRSKQRDLLIPSLAQASKSGALGVTKKSTEKRVEALDAYLKHLSAPTHMLRHSSEFLLFLGALFPLSQDLRPGFTVAGIGDPFGRTDMKRTLLRVTEEAVDDFISGIGEEGDQDLPPNPSRSKRTVSTASILSTGSQEDDQADDFDERESLRKSRKMIMIPSIGCKIEKIHLSQFRHRVFELIRYLFGFENASFVRNRMLAALKTASFAVTSNAEFQKTLYNAHTEHLSASSLSAWIKFAIDMLWPEGEFFTSSPPTPPDELEEQSRSAKEALHAEFPEQLRTILGQDLTKDGIDILHEMLQNKLVMKSVGYMLFDLLWLEVFPEIGDVLECGTVLDILES